MKTISSIVENELIIKNSKFITILFPIKSSDDVFLYLNQLKKKYPKATHYCYAYKFFDYKKCEDDGEPSSTAGLPILNVLDSEGLENILCVVIRYFGGIKLGAGGLVRAYSKSASLCIRFADLVDLMEGFKVEVSFSYNKIKIVDYLLKDSIILNKTFDAIILYQALLDLPTLTLLDKNAIFYKIIEPVYIQKKKL